MFVVLKLTNLFQTLVWAPGLLILDLDEVVQEDFKLLFQVILGLKFILLLSKRDLTGYKINKGRVRDLTQRYFSSSSKLNLLKSRRCARSV